MKRFLLNLLVILGLPASFVLGILGIITPGWMVATIVICVLEIFLLSFTMLGED